MGIAVDLFGIVMLGLVSRMALQELPTTVRARAIHMVLAIACLYGCLGFFGQFAATAGGLSFLPSSFEWPTLWPEASVRDGAGRTILGLGSTGRVQIYDPSDHFVRGWFIPSSGGSFAIRPAPSGNIEVFTARQPKRLFYSATGALLESGTYAPLSFKDLALQVAPGARIVSPFPLWPLADPFPAWGLFVVGLLGLSFPRWRKRDGAAVGSTP